MKTKKTENYRIDAAGNKQKPYTAKEKKAMQDRLNADRCKAQDKIKP